MTDDPETYSFRWGIPILDSASRGLWLYRAMLRNWHALGLAPLEFLLILLLADYHYESPAGASRPSLRTVAAAAGISTRHARRLVHHLADLGYLTITARPGYPNVYDCSGFARAAFGLDDLSQLSTARTPMSDPPRTPMSDPPRTPTSAEELTVKNQDNDDRLLLLLARLTRENVIDPNSPTTTATVREAWTRVPVPAAWHESIRRAKNRDPRAGLSLVLSILRTACAAKSFHGEQYRTARWKDLPDLPPDALL